MNNSDDLLFCQLFTCIYKNNLEEFKELSQRAINIETRVNGKSLLHVASLNGRKEVAELLIQKNADINAIDDMHHTPLHWASEYGHEKVVELLIAHKARSNVKTTSNYTPLHGAANGGYINIVKHLIKRCRYNNKRYVWRYSLTSCSKEETCCCNRVSTYHL